jgi:hypothetical protein
MAVDGRDPHRRVARELRCEFERTLKGECCSEKGCVELEGLWLCERHAYRLWREERAAFWRAMLAHTELWSRGRAARVEMMWWAAWKNCGRGQLRRWGAS